MTYCYVTITAAAPNVCMTEQTVSEVNKNVPLSLTLSPTFDTIVGCGLCFLGLLLLEWYMVLGYICRTIIYKAEPKRSLILDGYMLSHAYILFHPLVVMDLRTKHQWIENQPSLFGKQYTIWTCLGMRR